MSKQIIIKKGLDLPIKGNASEKVVTLPDAIRFAMIPDDFPGYTWKAVVKPGDSVKAGTPLLCAKENPSVCIVSPVGGSITEIHRGERRKIEYIEIRKGDDCSQEHHEVKADSLDSIMKSLCLSGLFTFLRQRPFDIVPASDIVPRDIFITGFDSAPLAPELIDSKKSKYLEEGIKILSMLTDGKVYLSVRPDTAVTSNIAEIIEVNGPHPAGNVGVQIEHIAPVNKGETVWTLDAVTASRIGKYFSEGTLDFSTSVAITGPGVKDPHIIDTEIGVAIEYLIKDNIDKSDEHLRVISGNVLTGIKVSAENGFLHYPYRQVTVIDEGDDADEFMGWASLNPKKFSVKRTFPAFLRRNSKDFDYDARIRGGHRAMIMSGEYDKVFPFDIYPEYLVKAILAKDIDKMEKLGIYEVAPEDFALPEFVDTSKLPLQQIVREGLDYLRKETV